jgi:membrane-associated phospholipid phosphatase
MRYVRSRALTGNFALTLWFIVLWLAYSVAELPYVFLRGVGDNLFAGHRIEPLERTLFLGTVPSKALQDSLFEHNVYWLDYASFLMHGFWFGVPYAFGIVLMIYQRKRLMEYMVWQTLLLYLVVPFFMFFPARPPWMEDGIQRVLYVRNYGHYVDIDNNPMAAFPSMHAALPMLTTIFFFVRCDRRLRFYGWLAAAYTVAVSFAIVYMGEHWVLDVFGGYAIAGVAAWICISPRMARHYAKAPWDIIRVTSQLNDRICAPAKRTPAAEPDVEIPALPEAA